MEIETLLPVSKGKLLPVMCTQILLVSIQLVVSLAYCYTLSHEYLLLKFGFFIVSNEIWKSKKSRKVIHKFIFNF